MPIYVYHCGQCGQQFESVQSITDQPLTECKCGASGTVRRVIQPAMVQYNAPGFYLTDYAGHGKAPEQDSTTDDSPSGTEPNQTPSEGGSGAADGQASSSTS